MTEQYSQTVEVTVTSKTKSMQWIGIGSILFSMGFLMTAIFYKWYFTFAFVIIFLVGCVYLHFYNTTAKEYIYEFSPKRLTIAKKDLMGKTRRMVSLMFEDVVSCSLMEGLSDETDIKACDSTHALGVYQIVYSDEKGNRRLLFAPDTYMIALIKEIIGEKFKDYGENCDE